VFVFYPFHQSITHDQNVALHLMPKKSSRRWWLKIFIGGL